MDVRVGQMGPQRLDPISTNLVPAEVKLLDGHEVGQVGPQRLDPIGSNSVDAEVKLLDGCKVGQMGPHLADLVSIQQLDIGADGVKSLGTHLAHPHVHPEV